jgi:hypothetical protein
MSSISGQDMPERDVEIAAAGGSIAAVAGHIARAKDIRRRRYRSEPDIGLNCQLALAAHRPISRSRPVDQITDYSGNHYLGALGARVRVGC